MIDDKDFETLDHRYRRIDDCDDIMNEVDGTISKEVIKIAVIEKTLKDITWLLRTVCGGIIAIVIQLMIFGFKS